LRLPKGKRLENWNRARQPKIAFRLDWSVSQNDPVLGDPRYIFHVGTCAEVARIATELNGNDYLEITFVTFCAVSVDRNEFPKVDGAAVWGFIRSLRAERPHWIIRVIDCYEGHGTAVTVVPNELEQVIRLDPQTGRDIRYIPRIVQVHDVLPFALTYPRFINNENEVVIVTGASGGIAGAVIKFMQESMGLSQCTFLCVSRSGKAPNLDGCVPVQCDVSSKAQVESKLSKHVLVRDRCVGMIIHAAGVLEECPIDLYTPEWAEKHFRVKVTGAKNLFNAFSPLGLRQFITFSSTSALFGMKNGAAYAASNAALDAFVETCRGDDIAMVNIQWDMWNETGMAHERKLTGGQRGLSSNHACQSFLGLLLHPPDHPVIIIDANWDNLYRVLGKNPMLEGLLGDSTMMPEISDASKSGASKEVDNIVNRVLTFPTMNERASALLEWLAAKAAGFIEASNEFIQPDMVWQEIGFDSLSMTGFIATCNTALGLNDDNFISDSAMFDYPTPKLFADSLLDIIEDIARGHEGSEKRETSDAIDDAGVAVVGMGLRFPGARKNTHPKGFWEFLCENGDAITDVPVDRFDMHDLKDVYVHRGGFLHQDIFYSSISGKFRLSDAEISAMDPHQIIALQVASEALGSAKSNGANMDNVGVFVGAQNTEFVLKNPSNVNAYTATGTALSIIANRISYCFNLTGPSMTIDTACSSSIVALDTAVKALHAGDCSSALVLGVDIMLTPHRFQTTCAARMLSPNGRCATFSDEADGYARGEGCGAIVVTLDDGYQAAWAKVSGIGLQQDGRSANLTSPMGPAQEACIKRAHRRAGITETSDLDKILFVEAHGTGTPLGDPQELQALANVFKGRSTPLMVGAVKSNTGHLEAAAGIVGVIKAVMCLRYRKLPSNLHCDNLNPRIQKLERTKCKFHFPKGAVPTTLQPHNSSEGGILYAGVSSFGFGGTNTHVVLSSVSSGRSDRLLEEEVPTLCPPPAFPIEKIRDNFWELTLSEATLAVIGNHRVGKMSVIPATTYIEMVGPIVESMATDSSYALEKLAFENMLFIDSSKPLTLGISFRRESEAIEILSKDGTKRYASMKLTLAGGTDSKFPSLDSVKEMCTVALPASKELYATLGNAYRGPFQSLTRAWRSSDGMHLLGKVCIDDCAVSMELKPSVWLDVASHVATSVLPTATRARPFFAENVQSYFSSAVSSKQASNGTVWSYLKRSDSANEFDMVIFDTNGSLLASVTKFSFGFFLGQKPTKSVLFRDEWVLPSDNQGFEHPPDIIVDEPDCVTLHSRVQRLLAKKEKGFIRVLIRSPGQWGYLRCVRKEHPHLNIQSCLSSGGASIAPWSLEPEIRLENGTIQVRRLQPLVSVSVNDERAIDVETGATYLVTGGLGALGLAVTNELLARGAGQVVLVGRRLVPSKPIPANTVYVSCDIADLAALKKCLSPYLSLLKGIIHCAAVLADATIVNMSTDSFEGTFAAKVYGAQNLDKLALPNLSFFVLFSSIAGSVGSAGQANYGAANSALDALARERHVRGLPALSIRWGPWGGDGMAAELSSKWERLGLHPLEPTDALNEMFSLCVECGAVVTICDFATSLTKQEDRYYSELGWLRADEGQRLPMKTNISQQDTESIRALVLDVANLVTANPDFTFELELPWREAGLDSLSMVEYKNILQEKLPELELYDTVLFDYTTPNDLATWIVTELGLNSLPVQENDDTPAKNVPNGKFGVIGAACRLPGGATSPELFWNLLCSGESTIRRVPPSRFDTTDIFDTDATAEGKMYTCQGGFLDDIEHFDNERFKISEVEVEVMDPQQRIALEIAYEALAEAGLHTQDLRSGKRIGVYVGVMTNDWASMTKHGKISAYSASGHSPAVIANRISYVLGLNGPSMSIDTACSSSLVALDVAMGALGRGDCDAAIVLGVNLILSPQLYLEECAARMLSPNGRCSTFSKLADGYVRGEGCVGIVVQPYRNEQACWGVIHSSAINQDGRSANLTSPNGISQQDVINHALTRANISPHQVGYIETHGTGTPLGDPMEIHALSCVFGQGRESTNKLVLGAVKTIVGHGEGAAGLTGLLKALLCIKHGQVPGNLNLASLKDMNPNVSKVATDTMHFPLVHENVPLEPGMFVGVSSFGFGGTNAHIILGKADTSVTRSQRVSLYRQGNRFPWILNSPHVLDKPCTKPFSGVLINGVDMWVPGIAVLDYLLGHICEEHVSGGGYQVFNIRMESMLLDPNETISLQIVQDDQNGFYVQDQTERCLVSLSGLEIRHEDEACIPVSTEATDDRTVNTFYDVLERGGWTFKDRNVSCIHRESSGAVVLHFFEDRVFSPYLLCEGALALLVMGEQLVLESCTYLPELVALESIIVHRCPAQNSNIVARIVNDSMTMYTQDRGELKPLVTLTGLESKPNTLMGHSPMLRQQWFANSFLKAPRHSLCSTISAMNMLDDERGLSPKFEMDAKLEVYCAAIICRVVDELGVKFIPGAAHHQLLFSRWVEKYYSCRGDIALPLGEDQVEFQFIDNCKEHLRAIMLGELQPLDVLFSDPTLTTRLYTESTPSMACNSAVAKAVKQCVLNRPSQGTIKILELGAGTGGTTIHMVDFLDAQDNVEYVFSDISDYFLKLSAERFKSYPWMKHMIVDIEKASEFNGQFDIVIASNIIHATKILAETLSNVHNLLAPGGLFLLNEATESIAFLDATFALTKGWWRYSGECDLRTPSGPLLPVSSWEHVLGACGFDSFRVLHRAPQSQVVFAAQKGYADQHNIVPFLPEYTCVIQNDPLSCSLRNHSPHDEVPLVRAKTIIFVLPQTMEVERRELFDLMQRFCHEDVHETLLLVTDLQTCPMHGIAWGLGRSVVKELALFRSNKRIICLDVANADTSIEQATVGILTELSHRQRDSPIQVQLRGWQRYESICTDNIDFSQGGQPIQLDGTYVVTGGLGGLGLVVALWLLEKGVRNLVLLSRSGKLRKGRASSTLEESLLNQVQNWGHGSSIHTMSCDVTNLEDLSCALGGPFLAPIKGIIHSAGVLSDGLFKDQTWDSFCHVVNTKVKGAMNLHALAEKNGWALDHFVMFSSAAGFFGAEGQSNHSAANAALDALCAYRRSKHLPGVAIDWGGWWDIGFAADTTGAVDTVIARGMGLLGSAAGLAALDAVISSAVKTNIAVVPICWQKFAQTEVDAHYIKRFVVNSPQNHPKAFEFALPAKQHGDGVDTISTRVRSVLHKCGIDCMSSSFVAQGLDSLSSIEVIGAVRDEFGVGLTPTFYIDFENGELLVDFIAGELGYALHNNPEEAQPEDLALSSNSSTVSYSSDWLEPRFAPAVRVFCFAYAGGHPNIFKTWQPHMPGTFELCPVSMPGFGKQTSKPFWKSVQELAAVICDAIPLDKPFILVGSCLGAIIAFEVKLQLERTSRRVPEWLFTIACSAPQDYSDALRRLYSGRLKQHTYFVPSDQAKAVKKFSELSDEERDFAVHDLQALGFFQSEETVKNLTANQEYFEHVMTQLAGQMQLAERYSFIKESRATSSVPITSISGALDETIPMGWPRKWGEHTSNYHHEDIHDGGHYIVHTHPAKLAEIVLANYFN